MNVHILCNIVCFLLTENDWNAMKEYMTLFFIGILLGIVFPAVKPDIVFYFIAIGGFILFINIPVTRNEMVYKKSFFLITGFVLPIAYPLLPSWGGFVFGGIILSEIIAPYLTYCVLCQTANEDASLWDERNYFSQRKEDMERILHVLYKQSTISIGVEAERGAGKSFLMEGVREKLSDKGAVIVTIDVMAVRLDNFAEYLICELDDVLYREGYLSLNSRRLKQILKTAKLDVLSFIWGNSETRYAKLFDMFRNELLNLNKHIVLIYEDIDRVDDVAGIKNILYLSEKLAEKNEELEHSSIKTIYQYTMAHMRQLGLDSNFLEKYIQNRIALTRLSLSDLIQAMQIHYLAEDQQLNGEDILRLPPFLHVGSRAFFDQEREWMERYFSDRFTVRQTKSFLQALAARFERYPYRFSGNERSIIIAFSFIEYFMPDVYNRMYRRPLYSGFNIAVDDQSYMMLQVQQARREDLLNPVAYPLNFELYIAWRLLGLDTVSRYHRINYQENTEP